MPHSKKYSSYESSVDSGKNMSEREIERKRDKSHSCNLNGNCALFYLCNMQLETIYIWNLWVLCTCLFSTAFWILHLMYRQLDYFFELKIYAIFIYCTLCDCWWDASLKLKEERIFISFIRNDDLTMVKLHFYMYLTNERKKTAII